MKTSLFIGRCVRAIESGETLRKRYNSSVMVDGDTIYSYGYHYPLLFRIEDSTGRMLWVLNNGGYSVTTSKHISYASRHADVHAKIGGIGGFFSRKLEKKDVIEALQKELKEIQDTKATKKQTLTQTYKALEREEAEAQRCLEAVTL